MSRVVLIPALVLAACLHTAAAAQAPPDPEDRPAPPRPLPPPPADPDRLVPDPEQDELYQDIFSTGAARLPGDCELKSAAVFPDGAYISFTCDCSTIPVSIKLKDRPGTRHAETERFFVYVKHLRETELGFAEAVARVFGEREDEVRLVPIGSLSAELQRPLPIWTELEEAASAAAEGRSAEAATKLFHLADQHGLERIWDPLIGIWRSGSPDQELLAGAVGRAERDPDNAAAQAVAGVMLWFSAEAEGEFNRQRLLDKHAQAARHLEKALQSEGGRPNAWALLARSRIALRDIDGAEEAIRRARELDTDGALPQLAVLEATTLQWRDPAGAARILRDYLADAHSSEPIQRFSDIAAFLEAAPPRSPDDADWFASPPYPDSTMRVVSRTVLRFSVGCLILFTSLYAARRLWRRAEAAA